MEEVPQVSRRDDIELKPMQAFRTKTKLHEPAKDLRDYSDLIK
jgi:hypothetical protein